MCSSGFKEVVSLNTGFELGNSWMLMVGEWSAAPASRSAI